MYPPLTPNYKRDMGKFSHPLTDYCTLITDYLSAESCISHES
jgi:hypothetical protein